MAGESRKLNVSISPKARTALEEIWIWNCLKYGADHAHAYVRHLLDQTNDLPATYRHGKGVPGSRFSYLILRQHKTQHAHLVVYELINDVIHVLTYYHTAQDWQKHLADKVERPDSESPDA